MRVAIIGTGRRCQRIYAPVVAALPSLELAGVSGRHADRTAQTALRYGCRAYASVEAAFEDASLDLLIVCADWRSNAALYRRLASSALPALIETPLAEDFHGAVSVARALHSRRAPTEVAEQYYVRPVEVVKRQLISEGTFGQVVYAFNDGVGHEYHGVSLIRSYIGFERTLLRAAAVHRDAPCFPHSSHAGVFFPGERQQHALLEFDSGVVAAHHWSWLSYESPIRARRNAGFHGTRGAAWGEEMVAFVDEKRPALGVRIERRTRVVEGLEVLYEIVAFHGDRPVARWQNHFPDLVLDEEQAVAAGLLRCLVEQIRGLAEASYPPSRALEDHRIVEAINRASATAGWVRPPEDTDVG